MWNITKLLCSNLAKHGIGYYVCPGTWFRAHRVQAQKMPRSHDTNRSLPMDMSSLGVMDLDLSLSPDAFGLRAFDHEKPITRMLSESTPCELRLMLPDSKLGTDRFHDVRSVPVWNIWGLGGSTFFALKNVAKFFPPWTMARSVWWLLFGRMSQVLRWMRFSFMRRDIT